MRKKHLTRICLKACSTSSSINCASSNAMTHKKVHDKKEKSFRCDKCEKSFKTESKMVRPAAIQFREKYCCQICNKRSVTDVKLKRHELMHSKAGKHVCESCNEPFSSARLLVHHNKTHDFPQGYSNNDSFSLQQVCYVCSQCGGSFNESNLLEEHVLHFH